MRSEGTESVRPAWQYRMAHPGVMWLIVLAGIGIVLLVAPEGKAGNPNAIQVFAFILSFLYWVYFFAGAIRANHSVARSVAGVRQIATQGAYRLVRHPIYSGDIALAWGVFALVPTVRVFFSVAWLSAVLFAWAVLEETLLEETHGNEYRKYKKRVPRLFPLFR